MRKSAQAKVIHIQSKIKEKGGPKSKESLAEAQKALRVAQAEDKRERKARLQAERALTEAQEKLAAAQFEAERESQSQIRRVSFVVWLTLDEQGKCGRTEIEHVSSEKKQNFLNLDGDLLVAFIKACINPETIQEEAISTKPPQSKLSKIAQHILLPIEVQVLDGLDPWAQTFLRDLTRSLIKLLVFFFNSNLANSQAVHAATVNNILVTWFNNNHFIMLFTDYLATLVSAKT